MCGMFMCLQQQLHLRALCCAPDAGAVCQIQLTVLSPMSGVRLQHGQFDVTYGRRFTARKRNTQRWHSTGEAGSA
jgi:hypothetical protein